MILDTVCLSTPIKYVSIYELVQYRIDYPNLCTVSLKIHTFKGTSP